MSDSFVFLTNRQNKTSIQSRKKPKSPTLTLSNTRPLTSSHLQSTPTNPYPYHSLLNAEQQLNQTIGPDSSSYVIQNIRKFTRKHNETRMVNEESSLDSTIKSCQSARKSRSQPRNVRQMRLCGLGIPVHCRMEQVLGEPFFVNAKEKFARMIARNKQKQLQFHTLQLKVKQIQQQKHFTKILKDKQFKNPQPVTNSEWDNEWRNQIVKQVARYRTRLSVKHKKKTSNFTIQI